MKQSGQIGITSLLTVAGAVLVAMISGYFSQAGRTDARLELVKQEQQSANLGLAQRITANETKVDGLQSDLREVKTDVKEILRTLRKQ